MAEISFVLRAITSLLSSLKKADPEKGKRAIVHGYWLYEQNARTIACRRAQDWQRTMRLKYVQQNRVALTAEYVFLVEISMPYEGGNA